MPTKRRFRLRRRVRVTDLSDWAKCDLLHFGDAFQCIHRMSADDLCYAWKCNRVGLLADWIATHPGTRPWAWWECEASEARRLIGGVLPDRMTDATPPGRRARFAFGRWNFYEHERFENPPVYESEFDYLSRLGLLTPADHAAPPPPYTAYDATPLAAIAERV